MGCRLFVVPLDSESCKKSWAGADSAASPRLRGHESQLEAGQAAPHSSGLDGHSTAVDPDREADVCREADRVVDANNAPGPIM